MVYDLVQCPHRVFLDVFGDRSRRDEVSPFVNLLWERGSAVEQEAIAGLQTPYLDLSQGPLAERQRLTLPSSRGSGLSRGFRRPQRVESD